VPQRESKNVLPLACVRHVRDLLLMGVGCVFSAYHRLASMLSVTEQK